MTNLLRKGGKGRRLFEIEIKNERKKIWQWFPIVAAGRPPESCPIPASPKLVVSSCFVLCSEQGLEGTQLLQLLADQKVTFQVAEP